LKLTNADTGKIIGYCTSR